METISVTGHYVIRSPMDPPQNEPEMWSLMFLCCFAEQAFEQILEVSVIWDAVTVHVSFAKQRDALDEPLEEETQKAKRRGRKRGARAANHEVPEPAEADLPPEDTPAKPGTVLCQYNMYNTVIFLQITHHKVG